MDYKSLYSDLTKKLESEIPITAYPVRELVQIFRDNGNPITLKSKLTITSVFNSGDISGIMCAVMENSDNVIACSLTHLIFDPNFHLYKDIIDYQQKRFRRIKQLNRM
ncbi:hypothetical protein BH20BAC1_BH20BAC1_11270 [soil metagenome]